jgi:hypothetical protein
MQPKHPVMKCYTIFLGILFFQKSARTQIIRDSFLIAGVYSIDSVKEGYRYYTIRSGNLSHTPISILYSKRKLLLVSTETRLAAWDSSASAQQFYLGYSAGEIVHDHWVPAEADNPFIILPYQVIDFSIAVPVSRKEQYLNFDYVVVPNLCYEDLRKNYLMGRGWTKPYRRFKRQVKLNVAWPK